MKKWVLKAVVQKVISYFPKREKINYFFQKYVTKGVYLTDDYFTLKIIHAKDHIQYYNNYKATDNKNSQVVELGTGWYPIIPISLFLNGFDKIISIDTQSWLTKESLLNTIKHFIKWKNENKLQHYLPNLIEKKWDILLSVYEREESMNLKEICNELNMDILLQDARRLQFKNASIDFICSNNTFEHIPEKILTDILTEFNRILKDKGVMSHFIDMSDHFAHFDKTINIYNFLKFSDKSWGLIDNSIQPQNRLRLKDYKVMYEKLSIPITKEYNRVGSVEELEKIHLSKKYFNYSPAELAISHSYLITKKSNLMKNYILLLSVCV